MARRVPRKIRDLLKDLRKAGFTLAAGGKGSPRKFERPAVKIPAIISGRDGDDAKVYLECHIAEDLVTFLTRKGRLLPSPATGSNNPDPVAIRNAMGISQTKFAQFIGVSVRTLHKWEQRTSSPSGAAKTLLKIAATNPHAVREALRSA